MIDYAILIKTYNDDDDLVDVAYHTEYHDNDFMWPKKQAVDLFLKIVPQGFRTYSKGTLSNNCISKGPMYSDGNYNVYIMGPTVELISVYHNLKKIIHKKKIKNNVNLDPTYEGGG